MSGTLKFYGVAHGFHRGVFEDWAAAQKEIEKFPQPVYKKFETREEAEKYVDAAKPSRVEFANCEEESDKWYAVARGKVVGVFAKYEDVQRHTDGYPQPLQKKFDSYADAKAFVDKYYEGKADSEGEKKEVKAETKKEEEKEKVAVEKDSEEEIMEKKETNGPTSAPPPPKAKKEEKKKVEKVEEKKVEKEVKKKEKKEEAVVVDADAPRETRASRRGEKAVTYYAVARGHKTGVFTDWNECKAATGGFKGARFKKFDDEADAKMFAAGKSMKEIEGSKRKASESDDGAPSKKAKKGVKA